MQKRQADTFGKERAFKGSVGIATAKRLIFYKHLQQSRYVNDKVSASQYCTYSSFLHHHLPSYSSFCLTCRALFVSLQRSGFHNCYKKKII